MLKSVAEWLLDAQNEDMGKYFFRFDQFEKVESGKKFLIIGRKGAGKTAIAEFINSSQSNKLACSILSFRNFPFRSLYEFKDEKYSISVQYVTLWKYVICSELCRMMSEQVDVEPGIRSQLSDRFGGDPLQALDSKIRRWLVSDASIQVLGTGFSGKKQTYFEENVSSWQERAEQLEGFVLRNINESRYFIVFDELQEDYTGVYGRSVSDTYFNLIKGLIKAVIALRASFAKARKSVFPVVLLRDDIYGQLVDADKSNWDDMLLDLTWSAVGLRNMLTHRMTADFVDHNAKQPLEALIKQSIRISPLTKKHVPLLDYMLDMGHLRPRDIIKYLQLSAQQALEIGQEAITSDVISMVTKAYSSWFRQAIHDEIYPILNNFLDILDVFAYARTPKLGSEKFRDILSEMRIPTGEFDGNGVLDIMYYFSVVGARTSIFTFRYMNRSTRLAHPTIVQIHPGLRQSILF